MTGSRVSTGNLGDWEVATGQENKLAFGVLRVTQVEELTYANIDDNLAKIENMTGPEELR